MIVLGKWGRDDPAVAGLLRGGFLVAHEGEDVLGGYELEQILWVLNVAPLSLHFPDQVHLPDNMLRLELFLYPSIDKAMHLSHKLPIPQYGFAYHIFPKLGLLLKSDLFYPTSHQLTVYFLIVLSDVFLEKSVHFSKLLVGWLLCDVKASYRLEGS